MNHRERSRFVSILTAVIGATAFVAGCGSTNEGPPPSEDASGTSGAASTGGNSASGGSSGTGAMATGGSAGAGSGTGGSSPWAGGSAGGGIGRPCTASNTATAPADGLIASFMGEEVGINLDELIAFPMDSEAAPTFSTVDGSLHITLNTAATAIPEWPNVILGFGGCLDAAAFSGVQFSLSGSISGCTMQYATGNVAHQDANSGAPLATGAAGSYQPQATITAAELTLEPQTLQMPFIGGPSGGRPATPINPANLIFLLWQFSISPADDSDATPCIVDITIDDVKFY